VLATRPYNELLKRRFSNATIQEEYSYRVPFAVFGGSSTLLEDVEDHFERITSKVRRLESIRERLPLIDEAATVRPTDETRRVTASRDPGTADTIFIVHGRDEGAKLAVHGFLRDVTNLDPVILHNEASRGQTVIEKFEAVGKTAGFAIVLLTADDVGHAKDDPDEARSRGRQNVVFEFGFFVGSLGRSRVAVLYEEGVELPLDVQGLVYISYDSAGGWKLLLARELKAAGIEIDTAKLVP
jgi:predicted nucleotide-binding protein